MSFNYKENPHKMYDRYIENLLQKSYFLDRNKFILKSHTFVFTKIE